MDLVSYLEDKGVVLQEGGSSNHKTHCFFCGEDESRPGRLYINTDDGTENYGLYWCHLCEARGNLNSLRRHFGDAPLDDESGPSSMSRRILYKATEYYAERLLDHDDVFDYLYEERGLSLDTIIKAKLGYSDGGCVTYLLGEGFSLDEVKEAGLVGKSGRDFMRGRIVIPYFEYGAVVSMRGRNFAGRAGTTKYLGLAGVKSKLYGTDSILGENQIIICAGELDQLMLAQNGYKAIGVPGERIWKDEWNEVIEDVKRIHIIFDGDKAGRAGAEKLSGTLGPRSRVVDLPDKKDIGDFFTSMGKSKEDLDFLISKAKGGLLVTPAQAYDRWLEVEGNPNLEGLKFNIAPLDRELRHGVLPGQVVTLLARTNCLSGDTEVQLSRAKRGFRTTIKDLCYRFHGGKTGNYTGWDLNIPTYIQRCETNGLVRLGKVRDVWESGEKEVYKLTVESGKSIKATREHRFLTDRGYVRLRDLAIGDYVYMNVGKGTKNVVHHIDSDVNNNDPSNLEVLTLEEHYNHHDWSGNVADATGLVKVSSIEYAGTEMTYDIEVEDDPHNFIANEFVVHNSGKTQFCLNVLHRMKLAQPEKKILLLTLEQSRNEWAERILRIARFYNPNTTDRKVIDWWQQNLLMVDKNRVSAGELEMVIDQYNFEMGQYPDLIVVDYLGYFARAYPGEEYQRLSAAIMDLKAIAKDTQSAILTPHQANRTNNMGAEVSLVSGQGSSLIEQTSDLVLALWNPDQREGLERHEHKKELVMKVQKSRGGGVGSQFKMQVAPLTLAIVPQEDKLYERALWERGQWAINSTYEDVLDMYRNKQTDQRID